MKLQLISAAALSLLLGAPAVSFAQSRDQDRYDGGRVQRDSRSGSDRSTGSTPDSGYRGRSSQSGTGDRQRGGTADRTGDSYSRRGGGTSSASPSTGGSRIETRPDAGSQGTFRRGGSRGADETPTRSRGGYDRGDTGRSYPDRGTYGRGGTDRSPGTGRYGSDSSDRVRPDRGSYDRSSDRGSYDRGGSDRGSYGRGSVDRGGSDRGGYDRSRQDSRDYTRRSDSRDAGRYASRGSYGGGRLDRSSWSRFRARSFATEHRNWRQRGGYRGYRIPDVYFGRYFGRSHYFRPGQLNFIYFGGAPCFEYDDYRFTMLDPYPEYWGDDWYDTDDCYVDYADDGYYLYNRRYPDSPGVAISVNLRF